MALHMSIGLLFLGGGRASLFRSKESIAALLTAFYPRFPRSPEDNQYHLQPLRHLWVLAVDWRGIKAVDVETGKDAPVPLQVELRSLADYVTIRVADGWSTTQSIRIMAPCLLPPLSDIISIRVASERYYPAALDTQHTRVLSKIYIAYIIYLALRNERHAAALSKLLIYVKRRPGYLSYMRDPYALRERLREEEAFRDKEYGHGSVRVLAPWARPLQSCPETGALMDDWFFEANNHF